jgi:hypothetical protein
MRGMKWPRFRLRTLLIAIALLSIPMGWVGYQLNWIRQRHEFFEHYQCQHVMYDALVPFTGAPWQLRIFGENPQHFLTV